MTDKFIEKAKEVHGDKYDYSKTLYIGTDKKVTIICNLHFDFEQTPYKHLKGQGCKNCGKIRAVEKQRDTKESFISKANTIHGDKYDYSRVIYISSNKKVIIICKKHGEFLQKSNSHLQGNGCPLCRLDMMGKWNKSNMDEFIEKAIIIHGNRYDYSKVDYKGSNIEVIIICKEHGEFLQQPSVHLSGCGCNKCGIINMKNKQTGTTEEFIEKAIIKHGDKYNYSKVDYNGNNYDVIIICKEHGEFLQKPHGHLSGRGCNKCGRINMKNKQTGTTEEFIEKAIIKHRDKYNYSEIDYINSKTKVIIICKEHGYFLQTPTDHLSGYGCNKCGIINMKNKQSGTTEEFIEKSIIKHGDKYNYSKVYYINARKKIIINCKNHGDFLQIPDAHLKGVGCPKCIPNYSKVQIQWLNLIQSYKKIHIQHAENGGEFSIPETRFKADGYCKETNTIYEFHGDLWHGNPKVFKSEDVSFFGTTYGELYQKTLEKEERIRSLGFNLVVMWELDWKRIINSINILKRKFKTILYVDII
jgi:hypothetical protein